MHRVLLSSILSLTLLTIRSLGQTVAPSPSAPTPPPDQEATTIQVNPFQHQSQAQRLNEINSTPRQQPSAAPTPIEGTEESLDTPDLSPVRQKLKGTGPNQTPVSQATPLPTPKFLNAPGTPLTTPLANNQPPLSQENSPTNPSPTPNNLVVTPHNNALTDNQTPKPTPTNQESTDPQEQELATNDQEPTPAPQLNPADRDKGIKIQPDSIDIEEGSPLSRVLRLLALQAGINYIEPDISPKETIAFAVHGITPQEAFFKIARYKGFRIVQNEGVVELYRDDIKSYETLSTKRYLIHNVNPMLLSQSIANFLGIDITQSKGIIPTYPTPQIQNSNSSSGSSGSGNGSAISGNSSTLGGGEGATNMNTDQGRFIPAFPFDQPVSHGSTKTASRTGSPANPGATPILGPSLYIDHFGKGGNAIVIRATQQQHEELASYIPTIDVKEPQLVIRVQVFEIDDTNAKGLGSLLSLSYGVNANGTPALTFNTQSGGVIGGSGNGTGNITNNTPGNGISLFGSQGLGLLGGFGYATGATALKDFQINGQIQALAQRGRIHTLTQAQVIARNGVPAFISSTEQQYIETVNFSSFGNNSGGGTTTGSGSGVSQNSNLGSSGTQSFTTGITIEAIPTILGDGRIELNIEPIVSNQVGSTTGADGQTLPIIDSRNAPSNIIVHEGETIPIGGILALNRTDLKQKTPLLGDIPLLNFFFRQTTSNLSRKNLLILVTPYILHETQSVQGVYTADDAQAFKELNQDNSKFVVRKYNKKTTGQFKVEKTPSDIDFQQDNVKDKQKNRSWPFDP